MFSGPKRGHLKALSATLITTNSPQITITKTPQISKYPCKMHFSAPDFILQKNNRNSASSHPTKNR
jgi:hypothetical protein